MQSSNRSSSSGGFLSLRCWLFYSKFLLMSGASNGRLMCFQNIHIVCLTCGLASRPDLRYSHVGGLHTVSLVQKS